MISIYIFFSVKRVVVKYKKKNKNFEITTKKIWNNSILCG